MITPIVFCLAYVGGLCLALWRHPVYGLYAYVAVYYLDPPHRWWAAGLPDLRWAFVAGVITLIATVARKSNGPRRRWLSHPVARLLLAYVIWMWLQLAWALSFDDQLRGAVLFTKFLVIFYLIYTLIDTRERLYGFLTVHALGCLYLGILSYISVTEGGRLDGVGGAGIDDASSLGMQLSTGIFVGAVLFLLFKVRSPIKWIGLVTIPFSLNGLILAASRGGFLGLLAGSLAFVMFRPAKQTGLMFLYGLIALVLLVDLAPADFWSRMGTIAPSAERQAVDASVETRFALIPAQLKMAMDHPFGAGHEATTLLSFSYLDSRYRSKGDGKRSSHNTIMSALVDQGFPGLILWVWMLFECLRNLRSARRMAERRKDQRLSWVTVGVAASFISIVVSGLFAPFITKEVFFWCLALSCCLSSMATVPGSHQIEQTPVDLGTGQTRTTA